MCWTEGPLAVTPRFALHDTSRDGEGVAMAQLGPPMVMKVRGGRSPRLKPGVKSGLLGVTFTGVAMAPLGPPKVMKVRGGRSPRLKPGVKTAPLTPGFSPGLLRVTFTGAVARARETRPATAHLRGAPLIWHLRGKREDRREVSR
jgi:hypothetical protein